ncbi:actin-associated protein FAM107A [Megalops cyprinoides]|uniref:actin-associated protein FAM107A n=1 Tax=Megalops cyprinoides TaxID=118141 RepID=UPI001864AD34|nr:actin-associated protein FAM107A [Megalops cyprinoides]
MQQELWLKTKLQVLSSLKTVSAMTPATTPSPKSASTRASSTNASHSPASTGPSNAICTNSNMKARLCDADDAVKPESASSKNLLSPPTPVTPDTPINPLKASRTHQELHKELLLAHKKGLVVCSRPELQRVLERRRREQTQREEGEQARTPLEQVLLARQQRHQERERQQERISEEPQLLEFVQVRQNLRKIHSALYKTTTSEG